MRALPLISIYSSGHDSRPPAAAGPAIAAILTALMAWIGSPARADGATPAFCTGTDVGLSLALDRGSPAERPHVGLRVHPPVMRISDVVPGTEVELLAPVTVENGGRRTIRCSLTPIPPSNIGMRKMPGFVDIPDASWCAPAEGTLELRPGEHRSVPVTLSVPAGECYANKCWCVALSVQTIGGAPLSAAVYPYIYIETTSQPQVSRPPPAADGTRALPEDPLSGMVVDRVTGPAGNGSEPEHPPLGCLVFSSNYLDGGDVPAGATASAGSIVVVNRYDRDMFLSIRPAVPPERGLAGNVLITPGHAWVEDTGWLRPARGLVFLPAGEEAVLDVSVVSPSSSSKSNYRWEGYLEFSGPQGPENLVRVRWRTVAPSNGGAFSGGSGR